MCEFATCMCVCVCVDERKLNRLTTKHSIVKVWQETQSLISVLYHSAAFLLCRRSLWFTDRQWSDRGEVNWGGFSVRSNTTSSRVMFFVEVVYLSERVLWTVHFQVHWFQKKLIARVFQPEVVDLHLNLSKQFHQEDRSFCSEVFHDPSWLKQWIKSVSKKDGMNESTSVLTEFSSSQEVNPSYWWSSISIGNHWPALICLWIYLWCSAGYLLVDLFPEKGKLTICHLVCNCWSQSVPAGCTNMCLCVDVSAEALQLQSEALWSKSGRRSAELEELMRSLEQRSDVTAGQHGEAKLQGAYLNIENISYCKRFFNLRYIFVIIL